MFPNFIAAGADLVFRRRDISRLVETQQRMENVSANETFSMNRCVIMFATYCRRILFIGEKILC